MPGFCCCFRVSSHNRKFQTFQTLINLRKGWNIFMVSSIVYWEKWWNLVQERLVVSFSSSFGKFSTEKNRQIMQIILSQNFTFQGLDKFGEFKCMPTGSFWDYFFNRFLYDRNFYWKLRLRTYSASSRFHGISLRDGFCFVGEAVWNIIYSMVSMCWRNYKINDKSVWDDASLIAC